jgi:hypothetical protein
MKLAAADRTLEIEITLTGQPRPVTITLGAPDTANKAYYAQSSALPNAVFLLPETRFEKLLATPKFFSKHPK